MFFSKRSLAIDIHDNLIQAVLLEKRGTEIKLLAFNQIALPSNLIEKSVIQNKERMIELTNELLDSANPKAIKRGVTTLCSIPEMQIFTHLFEFPKRLNFDEIKKAVPFEAEKIIPYPVEQVYWDIQAVSEDKEIAVKLTNNVIYAAVPRDLADSYYEIFDTCGIPPTVFSLEAEGLIRSLLPPDGQKTGGVLMLDIGSTITTATIYDHKSIQDTINIPTSGSDLYEYVGKNLRISREEAMELHKNMALNEKKCLKAIEPLLKKLIDQVQEIVQKYGENNPRPIEKIILCGACLDIPGLILCLMQNLPKKVEIGNPWHGLKIVPKNFVPLQTETEIAKTKAVAFSTPIGLALRGLEHHFESTGINLVPERVKVTIAKKRAKHIANLVGIVMIITMCVNLFSFALIWGKWYFETHRLNMEGININQVTSSMRYIELKSMINTFNDEVNMLEKIQLQIFSVNQILDDILAQMPENIKITNIGLNHDMLSISLSGIAQTREDILKTKTSLEESVYVADIVSPLKNFDKKNDISFQIDIKLDRQTVPLYGSGAIDKEKTKSKLDSIRNKSVFID